MTSTWRDFYWLLVGVTAGLLIGLMAWGPLVPTRLQPVEDDTGFNKTYRDSYSPGIELTHVTGLTGIATGFGHQVVRRNGEQLVKEFWPIRELNRVNGNLIIKGD